jgi:hypothetical protein
MNNEKGMSLVSVMMAAAMMGGLALVLTQLGSNSAKIQRTASTSNEVNELYNRVQKYLLDSDNCDATLIKELSSARFTEDDKKVKIKTLWRKYKKGEAENYSDALAIVKENEEVSASSKLRVDSITFQRKSPNTAHIIIALDRDRSKDKTNILNKIFEISVEYDSSGKALRCYSQLDGAVKSAVKEARKAVCDDFGGDFKDDKCEMPSVGDKPELKQKSFKAGKGNKFKGYYRVTAKGYDSCSMNKMRFEDKYKDSSAQGCTITQSGSNWTLTSWIDEARWVECDMSCIKLCVDKKPGYWRYVSEAKYCNCPTDPKTGIKSPTGTKSVTYACTGSVCQGECDYKTKPSPIKQCACNNSKCHCEEGDYSCIEENLDVCEEMDHY